MTTLNDIKTNTYYVVSGFSPSEDEKIVRRLLDLGILPGQKIKVSRKSLLKKALLIEVRGYLLSIKSSIASSIYVEKSL